MTRVIKHALDLALMSILLCNIVMLCASVNQTKQSNQTNKNCFTLHCTQPDGLLNFLRGRLIRQKQREHFSNTDIFKPQYAVEPVTCSWLVGWFTMRFGIFGYSLYPDDASS